jgi:hypothetical protein
MNVIIKLTHGGIGMDTSVLRGLKRSDAAIAHLSEEDKDLVMKEKDERFPKTVKQPKDAEPRGDDTASDAGR